jgi:hypothetical protein
MFESHDKPFQELLTKSNHQDHVSGIVFVLSAIEPQSYIDVVLTITFMKQDYCRTFLGHVESTRNFQMIDWCWMQTRHVFPSKNKGWREVEDLRLRRCQESLYEYEECWKYALSASQALDFGIHLIPNRSSMARLTVGECECIDSVSSTYRPRFATQMWC